MRLADLFVVFCQVLVLVFLVVFRRSLRSFPPHLYFRNEGIFVRTNRVWKALRGAIIMIFKNKKKSENKPLFYFPLLSVPWTSPLSPGALVPFLRQCGLFAPFPSFEFQVFGGRHKPVIPWNVGLGGR